ncbi:MAG: hypothetical protein M5U12_13085 [Verrucomicrobia bacterium]|nr:hypothetical protein [Verrucomicrobiota bacterium]
MKTSKNSNSNKENSTTEATSAAPKAKASKVPTTSKPLMTPLVSADLKVETPQAVKAEKEDGWQTAKDMGETAGAQVQTPKAKAPKAKREAAPKADKAEKVAKKSKAEADADAETGDRLPGNLEELKATKGGLVSFLFLERERQGGHRRGAEERLQARGRASGEDRPPDHRPGPALPARVRADGRQVGASPTPDLRPLGDPEGLSASPDRRPRPPRDQAQTGASAVFRSRPGVRSCPRLRAVTRYRSAL